MVWKHCLYDWKFIFYIRFKSSKKNQKNQLFDLSPLIFYTYTILITTWLNTKDIDQTTYHKLSNSWDQKVGLPRIS